MRLVWLIALCLAALPASAESLRIPGPGGVALQAELFRPQGAAVEPAIVALHGCGGKFAARDAEWRELLTAAGHIVLFPDSFGSRGLGSQCMVREENRTVTASDLRRQDAIAAAAWLAAQPGTPAGGVVLLGWSDGASTVLAAGRAKADLPPGLLRGLVAFYPGCRGALRDAEWRPAAPLLILIGELDDWTPAAPCRALAERGLAALTLQLYPGAYHDFDAPVPLTTRRAPANDAHPSGIVHVGGEPAARADALLRVPAFIAASPPREAKP